MVNELELKVKEIIQRTKSVKSFRLHVDSKLDFQAGQYLVVTMNKEKSLIKPLSISSSPTEVDYVEFTKKITDSEFSKSLSDLKVGGTVSIRYPYGKFILKDEYKKIAFISGGIGITPIRSIIKYAVDKNLDLDIVLIYANRTPKDIAFKEDFDRMQRQFSKLKVVHILSQETAKWSCRTGRVNNQVIAEEIPDYKERTFFICGPPLMVDAMTGCLLSGLDIPEGQIVKEDFKGY